MREVLMLFWLFRKIWDYGLKKLKENWVLNEERREIRGLRYLGKSSLNFGFYWRECLDVWGYIYYGICGIFGWDILF